MENRLTTRREGPGGSNMPRVGVADDGDNEDEKVYYGFGVFMGLPLADLKAMKDDFVEQQALTGGPPRRALPSSAAALESRTHRVEEEEAGYERQEDTSMAAPQQQQQHARMPSGYERQRGEGPPREYADERERGTRYTQGPPGGERGERGSDGDSHSDDGSDEYGHKSHSLNFILH